MLSIVSVPVPVVNYMIQVDELKHGGRDIQVDNSNRIEYIHLMADYRLNRQVCYSTYTFN